MKKTVLVSFVLLAAFLFLGCQPVPSGQEESQAQSETPQEEQGKLIVEQVNPDGSKEQVMEINLEPDEPANMGVVPGLKGMAVTEDGFTPAQLTIAPGTKVFFQNAGTEPHWPLSADPESGLCPGFGPEQQLEPGTMWDYDFTEAGECEIQDRLNPEFTAHISVVAEE